MLKRIRGYYRRLAFEYSQFRLRRYLGWCRGKFSLWSEEFKGSDAEVLIGAHLHFHGGVRNHLIAITRHSKLKTILIPSESVLQRWGRAPFAEHRADFLKIPAPRSVVAVHTHVLPWLIDWARCHRSDGLRWIHTHHLLYYPEGGKGGIEPWQQDLNVAMLGAARDADVCLCVSKWEREVLKSQYDIDSAYLPNGVDVDSCDQAVAVRFCRRWKVPPGFVLWVGRMDPVKNPAEFVQLAAMSPLQQFVMVGGVTSNDIRHDLGMPVPRNLKLLPQLPHHQTLDALAAAGVVVVTSFREGLPTLVLEAMAMQKQIVVPEEPGCLDATDGRKHAGVYRHGDLQSLQSLVQDRCGQTEPAAAARERVLKEFDWRVIAARLDRIYLGENP